MLAGFTATAIIAYLYNQSAPTLAQTLSSGLLVVALGFLSPLHHLDRYLAKWRRRRERLFLFVCSGNTCRSPMAAAIANAEIAGRLLIPVENLKTVNARALSAGVSARVGEPLRAEAQDALRALNVPVEPHAPRNLTAELAQQAEMIFCMTSAHRDAVITMLPDVANKTFCLDEVPGQVGELGRAT